MIPQFGTLVLIRNIFGTQKWKTLFAAILQRSTISVQTLKLWENCLFQVSHEARRQSTAGQAKYMALKCLLDKRNHLTFFEKHQGRCFYLERTHDKPDLQMNVEHGKKFKENTEFYIT